MARHGWTLIALLSTATVATGLSPALADGRPDDPGPIGAIPRPFPAVRSTPGGPVGSTGRQDCAAVRKDWTAEARPQAKPEALLNAYSDSGEGWTGGDSTYSVELPGGRTAWIFSDTFLGPVNPDGSRPTTTPFINNSFVVQRGHSLKTVTGGTRGRADRIGAAARERLVLVRRRRHQQGRPEPRRRRAAVRADRHRAVGLALGGATSWPGSTAGR